MTNPVEEDDIRDFLVQNPDYLQKNPELLGLLQIPHSSGAAVSLVERQVSVLRDRNVDLRHRLRDLGSTARDNDQLFADTRTLVLAMLVADTRDELEEALLTVLRESFDVEYASLILFKEESDSGSHDATRKTVSEEQARARIDTILNRANAGTGALRAEDFAFLFSGASIVGSAAVAMIQSPGGALGLLAVGSSNSAHYEQDMGTLFLEFAAEVLAQLLPRLPSE